MQLAEHSEKKGRGKAAPLRRTSSGELRLACLAGRLRRLNSLLARRYAAAALLIGGWRFRR